jgi:hypothetical protein
MAYLSNLNYRTDLTKVYQFMDRLNNKFTPRIQQPIIVNGKEITDNREIAKKFNKYCSTQHSLNRLNEKKV